MFECRADLFRILAIGDLDFFFALTQKARVECGWLAGRKVRIDRPIFFFLERLDFAFALHDQSERHGLHAPGGKAAADFIPQKRRNLIADQPVEYAARLLCIYKVLIDSTRVLESRLHGTLGNFVERNALNPRRRIPIFFLLLFLL